MNTKAHHGWFSLAAVAVSVVACRADEPRVRSPHWGKDVCAYCRMAVSSRPYAAQLVGAGGRVRYYDDLGCLINDVRQNPELEALTPYVTDPADRDRWIAATEARFSGGLPTPMDFGFGSTKDGPLTYAEVAAKIASGRAQRGEP